jgi:NitT/TauT family transport system permease protein
MKATPIATIILILWFTFTDFSLAIFVVILMVTPIIWQNCYDGFRSISKEMNEVCTAFELSHFKKIKLLIIPSVFRYLIPAVITSIGFAWKAEISAEIMTYSNIGRSIQDYKSLFYDTASVFAWAAVIVTMSLILENLTKHFLRRIQT